MLSLEIILSFAIFYRWLEMQQMHCARLLSRLLPLLQQPAIPPLTLTYGRNLHARSWCFWCLSVHVQEVPAAVWKYRVFKTVGKELHSYIHPKSIQKVKFEKKPVEHEVLRATNVYFITYIIVFAVSTFLISFEEKDLVTTFTSVATTLNNVGPGLEKVGPIENFGAFTPFSKCVFMFDMIAGRLELFPLLILFHPALWKDTLFHRSKDKKSSRRVTAPAKAAKKKANK